MANRFIIIVLIVCCFKSSLYSQVNISFDKDCIKKNSAMFALTLIEYLGKEKVVELLEEGIDLLAIWQVDSLGRILNFNIRPKKELSKDFLDSIEVCLIKNNKRFLSCWANLPGCSDSTSYKIILKDLSEKNGHIPVNVAFPGELMILYDYEKKEANGQNCGLSRYRYLQEQMKKYLPISL
ncbi:MAG: hypothetical protein WA816_10100 [Bacteroidales bacterium]